MYSNTKIWMQSNDVGVMNYIYYFTNVVILWLQNIIFYIDAIF